MFSIATARIIFALLTGLCDLCITKNTSHIIEGEDVQFVCEYKPSAACTVIWYMNGTRQSIQEVDNPRRKILNITPHRNDTGSLLTCRVYCDTALEVSLTKDFALDVLYPPSDTWITNFSRKCRQSCDEHVISGQTYWFKCQSLASNPACSFQWEIDDSDVAANSSTSTLNTTERDGWNATSEIRLTVRPSHHRKKLVCYVIHPDNATTYKMIELNLYVDQRYKTIQIVTILAIVLAVVLVTGVVLYTIYKLSAGQEDVPPRSERRDSDHCLSQSDVLPGEFSSDRVHLIESVGEGSFGIVYKARAKGIMTKDVTETVAVKMLKASLSSPAAQDFVKELDICKKLRKHPNVVTVLGWCTAKEPFFLIFEFAPNGDLRSLLKKKRKAWTPAAPDKNQVSSQQILKFAWEVANGMAYLSSIQLIHRDLSTRNILLGEDMTCKVSDFGFSRDILFEDFYEMTSCGALPVRWMAIESIIKHLYTTKSDVWSFGVLLWELITLGLHPYKELDIAELIRSIETGHRLPKPKHCSRKLYDVMSSCWQFEPNDRPEFNELVDVIRSMSEHPKKYLEMTRFTPKCLSTKDAQASSEELLTK